jgi:hypothetical protein
VTRRPISPETADVELTATVEADELRFSDVPDTTVSFTGDPGCSSASGSDRTNLPHRVEPGRHYRRVELDYRLAAELVDPMPTGDTTSP